MDKRAPTQTTESTQPTRISAGKRPQLRIAPGSIQVRKMTPTSLPQVWSARSALKDDVTPGFVLGYN